MIYNEYLFLGFTPRIPTNCNKPPTVYAILNSIVNFGKSEKEKIKDLAKYGRSTIFDFNYPLSNKVSKEEFECMILNHFLMRRIGLETVTAFKIQLNVKLNEIMPLYNKLFDLLYDNDLFGEITKREGTDNRITNTQTNKDDTKTNETNTTSRTIDDINETNNTSTEASNQAQNTTSHTSDKRYSDTPQNQLNEVRNGNYVTEYTYTDDDTESQDMSESTGLSQNSRRGNNVSENTSNSKMNDVLNSKTNSDTTDDNKYQETITKVNMFDIYMKMNEDIKNIYTMIFKDLDCLFYQLV